MIIVDLLTDRLLNIIDLLTDRLYHYCFIDIIGYPYYDLVHASP